MIRIIFESGELMDCDNIEKIFIEEFDHDNKVVIVGKLLPIGKQEEKNLCESCFNTNECCQFQSGIKRSVCAFYKDEDLVIDTEGGY